MNITEQPREFNNFQPTVAAGVSFRSGRRSRLPVNRGVPPGGVESLPSTFAATLVATKNRGVPFPEWHIAHACC
jgi:hypothetical protein